MSVMRSSTSVWAAAICYLLFPPAFQATFILAQEPKSGDSRCKVIPGDIGWPSTGAWNQLNQTVGGRLISTVPQAAVCYPKGFAGIQANQASCADLAKNWDFPQTLYVIPCLT